MIVSLTYVGPFARGRQSLPNRTVHFVAGDPVEFTVEELPYLDPETWTGPRSIIGLADGNIPAVLDRVGTDPELARLALDQELTGRNRKSLVAQLTELAGIDLDPEES